MTSPCALTASGTGDARRKLPRCSDAREVARTHERACVDEAGSCALPMRHAAAAGLQRASERISAATCAKPRGTRCIWHWLLLLLLLAGCMGS